MAENAGILKIKKKIITSANSAYSAVNAIIENYNSLCALWLSVIKTQEKRRMEEHG
jgi:hypothetical protein